ncbi:MAG TPA: TonB-dependent receptor [Geobacteraceae bacterium]|nr:TonB-dependent receptor [Geobacteraceae bacterium]
MHKKFIKTTLFFIGLAFYWCGPVFAQPENEENTLKMFYNDDDIMVTPTRYPKSISRIAENVTIITADDIKAVNAHTVTDVLNYVTGVQVAVRGGPGAFQNVFIQGSAERHVLVMIDGVSQNTLAEGIADIGAIPVQNIERIEIIKGPASSVWGSSLGGVINIITKSPDDTRKFGGTASASIGNRNTGDYRGEVSGKVGDLGYYLNGGGLVSDGLTTHNSFNGGNMYTKLQLAATDMADLTFTFGYNSGFRLEYSNPDFNVSQNEDFANLFSTISLDWLLTNDLSLDLSLHAARKEASIIAQQLNTGIEMGSSQLKDTIFGGNAKLTWTEKHHQMLVGLDFDLGELEGSIITNGKQHLDKWAIFINDTLTYGDFSLTPGLRYDYTSNSGDFWSPSFGVTYTLAGNTVLRADVARGFTSPPLGFTSSNYFDYIKNPNLQPETVWSYAAGFESTALRYFWLKTTFFRHDINDVLTEEPPSSKPFTYINKGKQRRQGVEAEIKTMPIYNTSLMAGYAYLDAKDRETGAEISGTPKYTIDAGIQYDDKKTFQATLKGHYIRWIIPPPEQGKFNAMTWDLNLSKKVFTNENRTVELFFTAHNIFNSAQFPISFTRNPGRWFEGGARFDF